MNEVSMMSKDKVIEKQSSLIVGKKKLKNRITSKIIGKGNMKLS